MPDRTLSVVVLAAGEGTRMKSRSLPKVLHGFAGRTLLGHVLAACAPLDAAETLVVVGHRREQVIEQLPAGVTPVVQAEQRGTGHAVRLAMTEASGAGTVLVVPGDAPLLTAETLAVLVGEQRASGASAVLLSSVVADPSGYGRVVRAADGTVERVVEHRDATAAELAITEVATSVYAFDAAQLREAVAALPTANAQGEEYLPDVVAVLGKAGQRVLAQAAPADETAGVNDRVQLATAHRTYNRRLLERHMREGVTIVDPSSTWVDADVVLEPDVTLWPNVDLHGATSVAEGASIGPDVTLAGTSVGARTRISRAVAVDARIGAGVTVGPFAYLRPGTVLADGVHVGTSVEIKNSEIGTGSKVPHLSYVGDATIGAHSNIGAASVFLNYDGVEKHRSTVGDHVKVGGDTMLVAPVHVGDGAYTAAGAVITQDVPAGALARSTGRQENVAGWVLRKRAGSAAAEAAERAGDDEKGE